MMTQAARFHLSVRISDLLRSTHTFTKSCVTKYVYLSLGKTMDPGSPISKQNVTYGSKAKTGCVTCRSVIALVSVR